MYITPACRRELADPRAARPRGSAQCGAGKASRPHAGAQLRGRSLLARSARGPAREGGEAPPGLLLFSSGVFVTGLLFFLIAAMGETAGLLSERTGCMSRWLLCRVRLQTGGFAIRCRK